MPTVERDPSVVVNPIDAFIQTRLREETLAPSHEADRRTLIRRLYFDLTGLPPTPEEIADFVADSDPLAYEKLVDRLLASPRYGERWGRHWLDVVRFAESDGFEMNWQRRGAYPYRDWVIQSFNDDKPYDQFVREQIAGDALGADAGHRVPRRRRVGPGEEPGPRADGQPARRRAARHRLDDGQRVPRAHRRLRRCHDHKFDPISQVDYFRMVAVFAGVQHGERAMSTPATTRARGGSRGAEGAASATSRRSWPRTSRWRMRVARTCSSTSRR